MFRLVSGAVVTCGLAIPSLAAAQTFNPLWAVPKAQVASASSVSASPMLSEKQNHGASFFAGVGDGAGENILMPGPQHN